MNFYAHQERARRATMWLIVLFLLATVCVVIAVNLTVMFLVTAINYRYAYMTIGEWIRTNPSFIFWTSAVTIAFIGTVGYLKTREFSEGGKSVARALGATWQSPATSDPNRRRLYNVVEEISIAAGIPVPQIYVLEQEFGINAFVAGFSSADAVLVVTRSAMELLDRDELQGVIAHEVSHVLNGDMLLNMRMIGVLHGITSVSEWGRITLIAGNRVRGRVQMGALEVTAMMGMAISMAGILLIAVGYVGALLGNLIKAAILRQRELLADAAAVEFTRNPSGITGALKKIAAWRWGSRVYAANSGQINHMLIADGHHPWEFWFPSHPPLARRIRALDPHYSAAELPRLIEELNGLHASSGRRMASNDDRPSPLPARGVSHDKAVNIGNLSSVIQPTTELQLQDAVTMHASIPVAILDAAHSGQEAVAVILGILLSRDAKIRSLQIAKIGDNLRPVAAERIDALGEQIAALGPAFRLPLFNIAFPAIKNRSREQIRVLVRLIDELSLVDGGVDVFGYILVRVMRQYLLESGRRRLGESSLRLADVKAELRDLFSIISNFGHGKSHEAQHAYEQGMRRLFPVNIPEYLPPRVWTSALDRALMRLDQMVPTAKKIMLESLAAVVTQDGKVTVSEAELVHAVCEALHCPFPEIAGLNAGHKHS